MLRNALLVGLITLVATALAGCIDHNTGWTPDAGGFGPAWPDAIGVYPPLPDAVGCDLCVDAGAICTTNADCASGYDCDSHSNGEGHCAKTSVCTTTDDCDSGYICDTRATCVPANTCSVDANCPAGAYCDPSSGVCANSAICDPQTACASGMKCDPSRATCVPSGDDVPSCAGTITCTTAPPTCASGETPAIEDGCYTGGCITSADCDVPPPQPACSDLTTESACTSRSDCIPIYTGVDCTNSSGGACQEGDTGCTCKSFKYASCADAAP